MKIPVTVLDDTELTAREFRVYGHLALRCWKGSIACVGQRALAEEIGIARNTLHRGLEKLAKRGHISVALARLSRRTVYHLNSPVFMQHDEAQKPGYSPTEHGYPQSKLKPVVQ